MNAGPASPAPAAHAAARLAALQPAWPALDRLLDAALALPPAARAAWLDTLAGDDAAHRDLLRALLLHGPAVETGGFLGRLPPLHPEGAPAGVDAPAAGLRVGPFRLLSPLGRGGMGDVWLAEQADGVVERRVALKLPRSVWGDTFAQRLARERRILAGLDHPHIARFVDGGLDARGRPYLALAYIDGTPIDVHARERALDLRSRIDLLLQVMAAVAHAHARLVVHRDLKPGNILVTADGHAWLLDFGIAKLLEGEHTAETQLTAEAGTLLTPAYASPEQLRGEPLGTASDVYAMGAVAYELLAGERPYRLRDAGPASLQAAIAAAEVPPPSTVAADPATRRALRGDLDAILLQALRKQPAERYPTMQAFADDLRRHLQQQPVQARPDRLAYRAAKYVRRHRVQVAAGATALAALLGGSGVALWQAQRALQEAASATAVSDFLETVFLANRGDQADPQRMRATTARELLDRGADRIGGALHDAPEARLRLLQTMARMYVDMGLLERADALQAQRVALAREHDGPRSARYAAALADRAGGLAMMDRPDEALPLLREAGAVLDARRDGGSAARYDIDVALASLWLHGDLAQSAAAADRAAANARARGDTRGLVQALALRSQAAVAASQWTTARDASQQAITLAERDPGDGRNDLSTLYLALAGAQAALGAPEAAEAGYRRAIELARRQHAEAPVYLHVAARRYGGFLRDQGRLRESLAVLQPGCDWARSRPAGVGAMPAAMLFDCARSLVAYGEPARGLAVLDEAAALPGFDQEPLLQPMQRLYRAAAYTALGRIGDAAGDLAEVERYVEHSGYAPLRDALPAVRRAWWLAQGDGARAAADHAAGRERAGLPPQPTPAEGTAALADAARWAAEAGRADAARRLGDAALAAVASAAAPPDHVAGALGALSAARGRLVQGDADGARRLLEQAVAWRREALSPDSPALAEALHWLARARRAAGEPAAAARADAEARRIDARRPRSG